MSPSAATSGVNPGEGGFHRFRYIYIRSEQRKAGVCSATVASAFSPSDATSAIASLACGSQGVCMGIYLSIYVHI